MLRAAARREQILLVEDDPAVREVVALCLSEAYEVKQATTGVEALTILRWEPVAAVVLDYRLPDCTGLEVLTQIRAAKPCLPVVMVTGYGSEWVCASAFKLGVRDYLPKPLNVFELLRSVRRLVEGVPEEASESPEADRSRPALPPAPSVRWHDLSIQKAIKVIQHRYWDRLSLAELAREVGMSKYRFSRHFREVTGVTFRHYLLRVRLEKAKDHLAARQTSITEVAQAVGFGDLPRFDKLFKRDTGLTPSAYRARGLL